MAIVFFQEKKRQKYLVIVLGLIILLTVAVFRGSFFAKPSVSPEMVKPPEIKINFEVLKNPVLEKLEPFEEIKPWQEKVGRGNPFVPY